MKTSKVPSDRSNVRYMLDEKGKETDIRMVVGCIPINKERNKICLISRDSVKHPDKYVLPKGGWEKGEDEKEGARREVKEEAGLEGDIKEFLGEKIFYNEKSMRKTLWRIHIMEVTNELEDWSESKQRERKWFTLEEALKASDGYIDDWISLAAPFLSK